MTKNFYTPQQSPNEKLAKKSKVNDSQKEQKLEKTMSVTKTPLPEQPQPKRKVGRPKTRDVRNTCRNINVAVPIDLLDKWDEVKLVHGNNLTGYITKLLERDMENNYERYKDILNNLNNI